MTRSWVPLVLLAPIAITLIASLAITAEQEELLTPGEQVLKELHAATQRNEEKKAAKLVEEIGELYHWPASKKEQARLLDAVAIATKHASIPIRCAALRALGEMGDRDLSAQYVEPFLRDLKTAEGEEQVMLAAIGAAGQLRPRSLIVPLFKLAQKSSHYTIADQAFLALGEWCHESISVRKQVVEKVLSAAATNKRKRARWNRLRAPALRALQRLVGRKLNSLEMFQAWWRHAKTHRDPFSVGAN